MTHQIKNFEGKRARKPLRIGKYSDVQQIFFKCKINDSNKNQIWLIFQVSIIRKEPFKFTSKNDFQITKMKNLFNNCIKMIKCITEQFSNL